MRKRLTDAQLKSLKPAKPGARYVIMDTERPRLGIRITDKGARSFVHVARVKGANMTRRLIGTYPNVSLSEAREVAETWDRLIAKGIDPKVEDRRQRDEIERAARAATENIFAVRAEEWLRTCRKQRQFRETARLVDRELTPFWRDLPVTEISSRLIKDRVAEVAERSPSVAWSVLRVIKTLFGWLAEREHIPASPAATIRPKKLIGERRPRQRILSDAEIVSFWRATDALGRPYRQYYRLLLLTGLRRDELAGAKWSEVDLGKKLFSVPPERFKSDCVHLVPLSDAAIRLIDELPQLGEYLFTISGERPIGGFDHHKKRLDRGMGVSDWVVHDLRRTCRTGLAKLRVPENIAEMAIGHSHGGPLQRTYNLHNHLDEIRDALSLWSRHVVSLVDPNHPSNVVPLTRSA
jgi:integrase